MLTIVAVSTLLLPVFAAPAITGTKKPIAKTVPFHSPKKDRYGLPIAQIEQLLEARNTKGANAALAKVPRYKGDEDRRNMILGAILATDSNFDAALPLFSKVKHPEEAVVYEHMGDIYQEQKAFTKAAQAYQKAYQLTVSKDKEQAKKIESKLAKIPADQRAPSAQTK